MKLLGGKELDCIAYKLGLRRHRYFWFFEESDKNFRARLSQRVNLICRSNLIPLHCRLCS